MVYKWERGGGDLAVTDPKMIRAIRESGMANQLLLARKYQLTACWEIQNAFPYNIGSVQLDNQKAKIMTMTIGFYYEDIDSILQINLMILVFLEELLFPPAAIVLLILLVLTT